LILMCEILKTFKKPSWYRLGRCHIKLNTHHQVRYLHRRRWAVEPKRACAMTDVIKMSERSTRPRKIRVAPEKAMTGVRVNDTSVSGWRSTRQRWDSYGVGSQPTAWWCPHL
jgi:hypothetical protein